MKPGVLFQCRAGQPGRGHCRGWTAIAGVLCVVAALDLRATAPELVNIMPAGAQRGTELELTFQGKRLHDTEAVVCYQPGIEILKLNQATNEQVRAQVRIAPDCPLGEHHLRLRTATGISEVRTFFVGALPVVEEAEPNDEVGQAQVVGLNVTVAGVVRKEDVDHVAVEAKQGQRLSAEVEGMRLGRAELDPRLTLFGPDGVVLADSDDSWLAVQDSVVSVVAPADGRYVFQLREAAYGGSDGAYYRLHIGTFPRPVAVYPPGGSAGESVELAFFSAATGHFTNRLQLPKAPIERHPVFAELDGGVAPSPNWVRVSAFTNVLERLPNQTREQATVVEVGPPLALNGILAEPGEHDWFGFRGAKGEALEVNVYARQLRSPVDAVVDVFDAGGKHLTANDDAGQPDSALKFTPAEATNYFVRIRDHLGRGGPDYTYRIEITPVAPTLTVKIPEVSRNDTQSRQYIAVPRGNRFGTLISARRANFKGPLQFTVPGLPAGVTLEATDLGEDIDARPLVFSAAADAAIGGGLVELTATGSNETRQITGQFEQNIDLVRGPNNTSYYSTRVGSLMVAVTREVPFRVRMVEPQVPIVQAGSMRLEVVAERDAGFTEPIRVSMIWNPPGVSSQSEAQIAQDATNVFYQLNAGGDATARTWEIAVLAWATVEEGPVYVSSRLAPLTVATPYLAGKIETVTLNPGQTNKLICKLELLKPFEGAATIRLHGLPAKITAAEQQVTKDASEAAFDLVVDPKCPHGTYRNLFCTVDVPEAGTIIPHTIAGGGMLRVVPPKEEAEAPKVAGSGGK